MRLCAGLCLLSIFIAAISSVNGLSPPLITIPGQYDHIYIKRGNPIALRCHATGGSGDKAISYKWLVGETLVEVKKDGNGVQLIGFDSMTGELKIQSYDAVYNGDYICIASVDGASSMSQTQRLSEKRLDGFKDADDITVTSKAFDYLVMACSDKGVIDGPPNELTYKWYISKEVQISMDDGRLFIDANGNLHFTYLKFSDKDLVPYRCGYSMTNIDTINLGTKVVLEIPKQSTPQNIKPIFKYSNTGVQGKLGASVELECFFSGYDMDTADHIPDTKWFSNSDKEIKNFKNYELLDKNRILRIKGSKTTDEGSYYCQGVTKTQSSDKMEVKLDVVSIPIWVKSPESQTVSEKKTVRFDCIAKSLEDDPETDEPVWYINGKKVDSSVDFQHFKFAPNKKSLTIDDVKKPDDILCVQCVVKNNIGSVMGDACLNVLKPIKIIIKPDEIQKIEKGDTIKLTVRATTDPSISSLDYEWVYKNKTYKSPNLPPYVEKDPTTNHIFINTSFLTNEEYDQVGGIYTCRVHHHHDAVYVVTDVRLKDVTPAPVTASAGIDMWIIGIIIGIIMLVIVGAIIIFVICRKKQEGDYNVDKKETGAGLDPEKELRDKGFNDLSRPDYEDYEYPEKKPRGDLEYDDVPIGGDDESLAEYGDEEDTHFNEDGSFIGIYQKRENERQNHKTESTI